VILPSARANDEKAEENNPATKVLGPRGVHPKPPEPSDEGVLELRFAHAEVRQGGNPRGGERDQRDRHRNVGQDAQGLL